MTRALIITVAGESIRFRETLDADVLKCIYSDKDYTKTILNYQLSLSDSFNKIIIVGGYKFDELIKFVNTNYKDSRIELVFNDKYNTYGSGYSLLLGIDSLKKEEFNEIVFCEGDLYFDRESFLSIVTEKNNIISANSEVIDARKSVAFYSTLENSIKYIYDTKHTKLEIKESFVGIYNSGQVWKFRDQKKLNSVVSTLTQTQIEGTNLEIIEGYFSINSDFLVIQFKEWINCNTIDDYKTIEKQL